MNDRGKTWLSLVFFGSAFFLSPIGMIAGWVAMGFQTGLWIGGITFAVYFLSAAGFMATIKHPSWFTVWLPYLMSILYAILPDFVIGPLDDTAAVLVGSSLTFFLWLKKQPNAPRWIAAPLIGTTAFILAGGFIPGPFDELILSAALAGTALIGGLAAKRRSAAPAADKKKPSSDETTDVPSGTAEEWTYDENGEWG